MVYARGLVAQTADAPAKPVSENRNPFRVPDYRSWWSASAMANLGVGIQFVTVPIFIRDRVDPDDRALTIAAALTMQFLPGVILSLYGGVIADRVDRRTILIRSFAAAALVSTCYLFLSWGDVQAVWPVFLLGAAIGTLNAFANPARQSLIPQILPPSKLQNGVLMGMLAYVGAGQLIGPGIAGFLVDGPGLTVAFGAEVVLLTLGTILFFSMKSYPLPSNYAAEQSVKDGLAEGIRYALKTPVVPGLMFLVMVPGVFFAGPMDVNMVIVVEDVLEESDLWVGLLFTSFGVGIVVNLIVLSFWQMPHRGLVLTIMPIIGSFAFVGFGLSEDPYLSALMLALLGLGAAIFMGFAITLLQENVAEDMMGRVMAIYTLGFTLAFPVGLAQAGIVSSIWGPQTSLVASGIAAGILGLVGLILAKPVRTLY